MTNEDFADFLKNIIQRVKFEPDSEKALSEYRLNVRKKAQILDLGDLENVAGGISESNKGKKK